MKELEDMDGAERIALMTKLLDLLGSEESDVLVLTIPEGLDRSYYNGKNRDYTKFRIAFAKANPQAPVITDACIAFNLKRANVTQKSLPQAKPPVMLNKIKTLAAAFPVSGVQANELLTPTLMLQKVLHHLMLRSVSVPGTGEAAGEYLNRIVFTEQAKQVVEYTKLDRPKHLFYVDCNIKEPPHVDVKYHEVTDEVRHCLLTGLSPRHLLHGRPNFIMITLEIWKQFGILIDASKVALQSKEHILRADQS